MSTLLADRTAVFERIRAAVLQEATRPTPNDAQLHLANKKKFLKKLDDLCSKAILRPEMTADDLWRHVWTKIRYSGFRASYVTPEIDELTPIFNDFRDLGKPEWYFDPSGASHGEYVRNFLCKTGQFANIRYSKLAPKLQKILNAAQQFREIPSGVPAMEALFGPGYADPTDHVLWNAHRRLANLIGYTTALHVMMDIGFNCVKPDIWLVRLMCRLGWIQDILPCGSDESVIKRNYQHQAVTVAVITCARQIAIAMHAWHHEAPLREFDFVMVKYGQRPREFGICRSLHNNWLPVQNIMEWSPE